MHSLEEKIKTLLRSKNAIEANLRVFQLASNVGRDDIEIAERKLLEDRIKLIDSWLLLLNRDQEYVVRRHLIDHLSWPQLTEEHAKLWPETAKIERTLIRIMRRALKTLSDFTEKHIDTVDILLDDYIPHTR